MPLVKYVEANGTEYAVDADTGISAMEAAVRNGIPGIDGDCRSAGDLALVVSRHAIAGPVLGKNRNLERCTGDLGNTADPERTSLREHDLQRWSSTEQRDGPGLACKPENQSVPFMERSQSLS